MFKGIGYLLIEQIWLQINSFPFVTINFMFIRKNVKSKKTYQQLSTFVLKDFKIGWKLKP